MRRGELIEIPQYYSEKGVIIKDQPFFLTSELKFKELYNPADSDLVNTEKIFYNNFIALINKLNGNKSFDPVRDKDLYKKWYRQYFPYIDNVGNKMVLVSVLRCCHNIKRCYPDWQKQIIIILDGAPCNVDARYLVNLAKNTIKIL